MTGRTLRDRLPLAALVLLMAIAGARVVHRNPPGIAHGDEALVALRALGLMEHGHGWTPYWNGAPDLHKPPFYLWLVAAGYRILGIGETAVRLPSLVMYLGMLAMTYVLGRRLYGPWTGVLATLLAAWHPTLAAQSSIGMFDTTMICITLSAAWFLLRAEQRPRQYWGWGVCCGLALLTKGMAAAPILLTSILYLVLARRMAFAVPHLYAGLALAAAVGGTWFVSQFFMNPEAFVKPYYTDMVDYRLKHSWSDVNFYIRSPWFLWSSWGGLAPFSVAAVLLAWFAGPEPGREASPSGAQAGGRREALLLVLLGVVSMVMVSMVRQQMYWYMLPAVVPMALLSARVVVGRGHGIYLRLLAGVFLAAGALLPTSWIGPPAWRWIAAGSGILSALLWTAWRSVAGRRASIVVFSLGLAGALIGGLSADNPKVNLHRPRDAAPLRELARRLPDARTVPGRIVVNFRHYPLNTLMFHARRDSVQLREFGRQTIPPGAEYVGVFAGGGCREFLRGLEVRTLSDHAGYEIVSIRNATASNLNPGLSSPEPPPDDSDTP